MAQQPERVDSFGLGRSPTPDNAGLQHIALAKMLESADVSVGGTRAPHSLLSGQPPLPSSIGEATNRVALDPSPPYQSHDPSPPPPTNFQIAVPVAVAPPTQPLPLRRYPTPSSPDYLGDQEMTAGTTTPAQTTTTFLDRPEPVFVAAPPTLDPGSPGNHTDGGLSAASIASPRPPMRPSLIHDIALHAHALFSTPRSTPQRMDLSRRLSSLLHRVTPQHLQPSPMVANVEYYPIFESDMFTICAFALRAGASMPVHDHPEMNVFRSVCLWKHFDLLDPALIVRFVWITAKSFTGPCIFALIACFRTRHRKHCQPRRLLNRPKLLWMQIYRIRTLLRSKKSTRRRPELQGCILSVPSATVSLCSTSLGLLMPESGLVGTTVKLRKTK